MILNKVSWKVGGEAGLGIASVGMTFAKCLQRSGLNVFCTNDYPSLIKGGHNTYVIRGDNEKIFCQADNIDILVALNKNTILKNGCELAKDGAIIYDSDKIKLEEKDKPQQAKLVHVPLSAIATKAGNPIFANTAALGATIALLDMDFAILEQLIRTTFGGRKGQEVADKNIAAAKEGYNFVKANNPDFYIKIEKLPEKNDIFLTGNDAVCIGAIRAGCKFVSEYPMSPSSGILHYMAAHERQYGMVIKHAEDEIAAANMIVGAGFAGVRSMTGTSGGGFCLMVEALGLAGLSETPIVIVNVQRAGPSTGLPTYNDQADLQFALHASHGEFPRIVLAPGDIEECFYETVHAFNLAERTQTPVIVLSDKYLAESIATVPKFDATKAVVNRGKLMTDDEMANSPGFKRYAYSEDGVSPRCIPGQPNGIYVGTSYEHDETGWTSEDAVERVKMVDKRAKKMSTITEDEIAPKIYGHENADVTIVVWGSTKMPALEALKILDKEKIKAKVMHLFCLRPFPSKKVLQVLENSKKVLMVEGNSTAQCRNLIREKTGFFIEEVYLRYDARPFEAIDIANKAKELLKK